MNVPPTVYIIAGPNGAGKTTFATKFLPDFVHCQEFLNADLIASGLSPFNPDSRNFAAARIMLESLDKLASKKVSFSFETTLSGRTYIRKIQKLRADGYEVHLFFLWLPSEDVAVSRVANRVRQGGHNIPETDIRRRYNAGIRNFFEVYLPIVDFWQLYDATILPPDLIAEHGTSGEMVADERRLNKIHRSAGESK